MNEFLDTREIPVETDDVRKNRVFGILSYISILWLVGLIGADKSPYTRWHVNQGMILSILGAAVGLVNFIVILISSKVHGIFKLLFFGVDTVFWVAGLALTALMVFGIVNAARGLCKELPIVGKYHIYDTENKE